MFRELGLGYVFWGENPTYSISHVPCVTCGTQTLLAAGPLGSSFRDPDDKSGHQGLVPSGGEHSVLGDGTSSGIRNRGLKPGPNTEKQVTLSLRASISSFVMGQGCHSFIQQILKICITISIYSKYLLPTMCQVLNVRGGDTVVREMRSALSREVSGKKKKWAV